MEKGGFAFRIINTRNRTERTVKYTELRNINLKDVLMMEIDPKKFMQNAGKIIRQNSFKRGNSTALRLLDMSQGNLESQENPQTQPPHMYETVDKEGPANEDYLLSKLDTENVEHEDTQEVGNLFT